MSEIDTKGAKSKIKTMANKPQSPVPINQHPRINVILVLMIKMQ